MGGFLTQISCIFFFFVKPRCFRSSNYSFDIRQRQNTRKPQNQGFKPNLAICENTIASLLNQELTVISNIFLLSFTNHTQAWLLPDL